MRENAAAISHYCKVNRLPDNNAPYEAYSLSKFVIVSAPILFLFGMIYGQEQITINVDSIIHPATQRGSGILGVFSDNDPPDSVILPLKLKFLRGDKNQITSGYNRCTKFGASMEISTAAYGAGWSGGYPGPGNWAAWEKYHVDVATDVQKKGWKNISYSFWNDVDYNPGGRRADFYQVWKHARDAVKSVDSNAITVGPNNSWGPVNHGAWYNGGTSGEDLSKFVLDFIDSGIAHNCLPEILAFHDWSVTGQNVVPVWQAIENHLEKRGKKPIPFEEDDMGPPSGGGNGFGCRNPALQVSFLAGVERTDIIRSARCWWDYNVYDDKYLDGYITPSRKPRSIWWAQKSYADITGSIVQLAPGASIDGVAGIDSGKVIRMVLGRYKKTTGPVTVSITNLKGYKKAAVVALFIRNTEDNELAGPTKTKDTTVVIADGKIDIPIAAFDGGSAYQLIVTLSEPTTAIRPDRPERQVVSAAPKPILTFTSGALRIGSPGSWKLSVCDIYGRRIAVTKGVGLHTVAVPRLPPGGYCAELTAPERVGTVTFIPGR